VGLGHAGQEQHDVDDLHLDQIVGIEEARSDRSTQQTRNSKGAFMD